MTVTIGSTTDTPPAPPAPPVPPTRSRRAGEPDEPTDEALRDLVGLVDHDVADDPFPVVGMDAVVFVCGNATQSA